MKAEVIYDFSEKSSLRYWSVVDDGVRGGVSQGSLRINYEGHGVFSGYVSLENYGGFSSIRYNTTPVSVVGYEFLSIKVFGDDKDYQIRIKSDYYDRHVYVKSFYRIPAWVSKSATINDAFHIATTKYGQQQVCSYEFKIFFQTGIPLYYKHLYNQ